MGGGGGGGEREEGYCTVGEDNCMISVNEYQYMKHVFGLRMKD